MDAACSRRDFLRKSARVSALAALAGSGALSSQAIAAQAADGLTWQKAPCRFCGTGCGVMVKTVHRKAARMGASERSTASGKALCPRTLEGAAVSDTVPDLPRFRGESRSGGRVRHWIDETGYALSRSPGSSSKPLSRPARLAPRV